MRLNQVCRRIFWAGARRPPRKNGRRAAADTMKSAQSSRRQWSMDRTISNGREGSGQWI